MNVPIKKILIALAFTVNIVLTLFGFMTLLGSPYTGLRLAVCGDAACVRSVDKNSPAYQKINPGERLMDVEEKAISYLAFNPDPDYIRSRKDQGIFWEAQRKLSEVIAIGKPVAFLVERGGSRPKVSLTPVPFPFQRALARTLPIYLVGWTFIGIAYLVLKRKDHEITVANFFSGTLACASFITLAPYTVRDILFPFASFRALSVLNYIPSQAFCYATLSLALIFPHRKKMLLDHPWLIKVPAMLLGAVLILHFTSASDNTHLTTYVSMNACLTFIIGRLLHDFFVEKNPLYRKQIQWVIFGIVTGTTAWLSMTSLPIVFNAPFVSEELSVLPTIIYPLSFAFAVTKYRLMDIETIFDVAVIYGATIIILEGLELAVLGTMSEYIGIVRQKPYLSLLGVLMIVFLYVPLRNKVKTGVERLFKRGKYDADKEAQRFITSLGLRDGTAPLEKFSAFTRDIFGPSGTCIMKFQGDRTSAYFLEGEKAGQTAGAVGEAGAEIRAYFRDRSPCVFGYELANSGILSGAGTDIENSLLAFLSAGEETAYLAVLLPKWNKTAYSNKDRNLLRAISAHIANVLETEQQHVSTAKITPPGVTSGILRRERLFDMLDTGRNCPVIWVTGPAGSGKSTLASSWLDSRVRRFLWYNVDEGDGDIATFFYYTGLAAMKADAGKRKPLPLFTPEYLGGLPVFTKRWFSDLYSRLNPPVSPFVKGGGEGNSAKGGERGFAIVLDNYQDAPHGSAFHEMIVRGLETVPEGIQMIILSRSEPPAPFARLIANSRLSFLGWNDIRLTRDESREIVRAKARESIPEETLDQLHEMTGGWAAGLILTLEHTKFQGADFRSPKDLAPGEIFNYFANEIFEKMDEETRLFLLKTSFLAEMTAEVAEKLTADGSSWQRLYHLSKNHYFTERYSREKTVYRYHPLFREFLITRASNTFSPIALAELHRNAALLMEEAGQIEDAARLFVRSGEWEGLTSLVLTHAPRFISQGRSHTVEEWLTPMPAAFMERNPWLIYWQGICRMTSNLDESRAALERAYGIFKDRRDVAGTYLSWSGVVDTFVYYWGDLMPLNYWISEIEALLRLYPEFPSPEIEARVTYGIFCALMYRQPQHPDLPQWSERATAIVLASKDVYLRTFISSHLILYYSWWRGDTAKASLLVDILHEQAVSSDISPLYRLVWAASAAANAWITGESERSLSLARSGLDLAEATGVHLWDFMLLTQCAFNALTLGDMESAGRYLQLLSRVTQTDRKGDIFVYHWQMGWKALCEGQYSLALEHELTGLKIAQEGGFQLGIATLLQGAAEALIELGDFATSRKYLDEAYAMAVAAKSLTLEYQNNWLNALFSLRRGDRKKAVDAVRRLLTVSRETGIFSHAQWRPHIMAELYALALEEGIETAHVRKLVRLHRLAPSESQAYIESWPWPIRIYTLGRFEVVLDGKPVRFSKKAPKKPLEALKALIASGRKELSTDRLAESLWPQAEGDLAEQSLATTLKRLRALIGQKDALQVSEGLVSLDPSYCWVDAWAFEDMLLDAETRGKGETGTAEKDQKKKQHSSSRRPVRLSPVLPNLEKALDLYKGPFLPDDTGQSWAVSFQERLRNKFIRALEQLGVHWEQAGDMKKAAACYEKGIEMDDLAEEFYRRLMNAYERMGRRAEAVAVYQRCKKALAAYGIEPSPETTEIAADLYPEK